MCTHHRGDHTSPSPFPTNSCSKPSLALLESEADALRQDTDASLIDWALVARGRHWGHWGARNRVGRVKIVSRSRVQRLHLQVWSVHYTF